MTNFFPDKAFSTDYKSRYSETTLNALFTKQAHSDPSKIILHFSEQKFSYQNLLDSANKLAWFLLKYDIKIEDRIGVALD
ncbi:hypothetical protein, partial [Arachidicoccus sp.]|uniref:hypothetical protein n=1 Tax=Arachidicoccus sp. TaxID=1872624 RepID=UPI003D1BD760